MKREYKEVYDLVRELGFSCDYVKLKPGWFCELNIFSPNYSIFGGLQFKLEYESLEKLKKEILRVIKKYYEDKVLMDVEGNIYTPLIKENKLFLYNGVNELGLNEFKKIEVIKK